MIDGPPLISFVVRCARCATKSCPPNRDSCDLAGSRLLRCRNPDALVAWLRGLCTYQGRWHVSGASGVSADASQNHRRDLLGCSRHRGRVALAKQKAHLTTRCNGLAGSVQRDG